MLRPVLRHLAAGLLVGALLAAGACSDDDEGEPQPREDVQALLDRAFKQPFESADLDIDARLELDGVKGLDRPLRIQASGPYLGGGKTLPQFDLDLRVGAEGAGQAVESGFLSTGRRTYMKFGGQFYEQPRRWVTRTNRRLRRPAGARRGALRELGLSPRSWVTDARVEGDERVAGVVARHVSGRLAVRRVLADLNRLVERAGGALGGIPAGVPAPLDRDELDELAQAVQDPRFDVYVGRDDDVIRRVSGSLRISVPEKSRSADGLRGGALRFSIELARVNGDQRVERPARSRPLSDLTKQLGGALGALGAGGSDAGGSGTSTAPDGGEESYGECVDRAPPDDTAAIQRCSELLR